jgi:hypothetical protein
MFPPLKEGDGKRILVPPFEKGASGMLLVPPLGTGASEMLLVPPFGKGGLGGISVLYGPKNLLRHGIEL